MKNRKSNLVKQLLQSFIQFRLNDGTLHSGYIGNPNDFKNEKIPSKIVLINGLMRDEVDVSHIEDISFPNREETTKIPIVGFND